MIIKTLSALAVAIGMLIATAPAQAGSSPIGISVQKADFETSSLIKVGLKQAHHRKFKRSRRGYRHRHFNFGHGWYGYRGCGHLYRKARWTGSRYWWKQYRRCVAYHY